MFRQNRKNRLFELLNSNFAEAYFLRKVIQFNEVKNIIPLKVIGPQYVNKLIGKLLDCIALKHSIFAFYFNYLQLHVFK